MGKGYELILGRLSSFQTIKGREYPWIYIPKKEKRFKTGLYYVLDERSNISDANGDCCPFFIVRQIWGVRRLIFGERISLDKAIDYLTKHEVSVRKLRRRINRVVRVNEGKKDKKE